MFALAFDARSATTTATGGSAREQSANISEIIRQGPKPGRPFRAAWTRAKQLLPRAGRRAAGAGHLPDSAAGPVTPAYPFDVFSMPRQEAGATLRRVHRRGAVVGAEWATRRGAGYFNLLR